MKNLAYAALIGLFSQAASAATLTVSRAMVDKAYPEVKKAAVTSRVSCVDDRCTITWEPKKGASLPPGLQAQADEFARVQALARKWKDSELTAQEKDELLRYLVLRQLGVE